MNEKTELIQQPAVAAAVLEARRAVADATHPDDDVTVEDQGEQWIFEFVPKGEGMGGGARVTVAKSDFRVLRVVRGQ